MNPYSFYQNQIFRIHYLKLKKIAIKSSIENQKTQLSKPQTRNPTIPSSLEHVRSVPKAMQLSETFTRVTTCCHKLLRVGLTLLPPHTMYYCTCRLICSVDLQSASFVKIVSPFDHPILPKSLNITFEPMHIY